MTIVSVSGPAFPNAARTSRATPGLPAEFGSRGARLLNQQFWLWGQDIKRPDGNLLLERGFAKRRPPEGEQGSSAYTLAEASGASLVLWGFGLFYGEPGRGGVFVPRFKLVPEFVTDDAPPSALWLPQQIEHKRPARGGSEWHPACRLLAAALRWVSGYETWVALAHGSAYRRSALAPWPRPACPATETAGQWFRLAARLEEMLQRTHPLEPIRFPDVREFDSGGQERPAFGSPVGAPGAPGSRHPAPPPIGAARVG